MYPTGPAYSEAKMEIGDSYETIHQRIQQLEGENARLIGQIQGMWETMKFFKLNRIPGAIPPENV